MYAIGLDVGGTKIAGGLVTFPAGEVLQRRVIPTGAGRGGAAVLADAVALAESLVADAGERGVQVDAIGIGVAELVRTMTSLPAGRPSPGGVRGRRRLRRRAAR